MKFFKGRNVTITKLKHNFKSFASFYNVKIQYSINHKLQLKDTQSAIKNRLIELWTQLKFFKFLKTLFLVFQMIKREYKT